MLPFSRGGEIIHSQPRQEAHVQALNVHQHFCVEALIFPFVRMFLCVFMCVCLHAEEAALEATLEAL